jgi:hypothetical protein
MTLVDVREILINNLTVAAGSWNQIIRRIPFYRLRSNSGFVSVFFSFLFTHYISSLIVIRIKLLLLRII